MQPSIDKRYRRLHQELTLGIVAVVSVVMFGTLGYRLLEGWSWTNSLYMTILALSTVGFTEVEPLEARGRMFTILLILLGIGTFGFIINRFTEAMIQGYFQEGMRQRRQRQVIETLSQHYIICGFGRTGRQIAHEFAAEGISFVVIDFTPEALELGQQQGYITLQGDATLDETLQRAKIDRAACIVVAMPSDAENLYTLISAKTLNPHIRAIARANTEEAIQKLQRGGADAVVSPYITGGKRMAAAALRPQVMDFLDGILTGSDRSYYMEEFLLDPQTRPNIGKTLQEAQIRDISGALVLAIRRANGEVIIGPTAEVELHARDVLICMGTADQLRRLNQLLSPLGDSPLRLPKQSTGSCLSPTDQSGPSTNPLKP